MDKTFDVAAIAGSLRAGSINRKVAHALTGLAPAGLRFSIVEIGQLPIYNRDLDSTPPAEWLAFHDRIGAADAVIFVAPEHSRSVSSALKNASDVRSRPYGKNARNGKPEAIVSASPSAISGFGANHHLTQSLVFLNVPAMAQPEVDLASADKLLDTGGRLANEDTRKFLPDFMQAYATWVAANAKSWHGKPHDKT